MPLPIAARNRAIVKKTLATLFVSDIPVPKLRDGLCRGFGLRRDYHLAIADFDREDFQERGQGLQTYVWLQFRPSGRWSVCRLHPRQRLVCKCISPDYMSFEETATPGCGVLTIGPGLYQSLGLPFGDWKTGYPVCETVRV